MANEALFVVDTSVVIKWFSEEEQTDAALRVRRSHLDDAIDVFVPDLLLYELSNALRYNPNFDANDVRAAVESIFAVNFEIVVPAPELLANALETAHETDLTVYDATYVALAKALGSTFVTADEEIAELDHAIGLSEFHSAAG
jgi:predicted nucleic acid-binding protein